ncbi:MAG TPA: ROK family protein [Usitatibacter sp.]|nr:ROK family protein [Usitatibacter sp.]
MILAGDVGATKILLEVGEFRSDRWKTGLSRRYSTADTENFPGLLTEFLGEWNGMREKDQRITAAGFGVAGPVHGNKVKMTHRPLVIDGDAIASRLLIPKVVVVNDLAAAAQGIDMLGPRDVANIQDGPVATDAPIVVMGVGTGLGLAYLVPHAEGGYRVVAGESGHAGFAPANAQQANLARAIMASHGRCSVEDVCSGHGLQHIYAFLRSHQAHELGEIEESMTGEWIADQAKAGDSIAESAIELFVECIGTVAGDHALSVMARGGVYLTGGVVARMHERIRAGRFSEMFCAKGAMSAELMKIPVRAVTSERVVVLGAAKFVV